MNEMEAVSEPFDFSIVPGRDLRQAGAYIEQRSYQAGEGFIRQLLEKYPASNKLQFMLGICLLNQARHREAAHCFARDYEITEQLSKHGKLAGIGMRVFRPYFMGDRVGEVNKQLDIFAKTGVLGWRGRFEGVFTLHKNSVDRVNACLLDYWKRHVKIVTDPVDVARLRSMAEFNEYCSTTAPLPDGRVEYGDIAWHEIQRSWEDKGLPPILSLSDEHREAGRKALAELGVPKDAWFVGFHVREQGFHTEAYANVRNCQMASFLPAMQEIVDRGGWVIRTGDRTMTRMPPMKGVIDYPFTQYRSDWMDIYLIAASRFFVSTASGPCALANSFGVPQVQTNVFPATDRPWSGKDIFMPKLYRNIHSGELVSFAASIGKCIIDDNAEVFSLAGLEVLDNSAEDIRAAVLEMLALQAGSAAPDPEAEDLRKQFDRLVLPIFGVVSSKISAGFVKKHKQLLRVQDSHENR